MGLTAHVVEASSVNCFKKQLDDWSLDVETSSAYIHYYYKLQVTNLA